MKTVKVYIETTITGPFVRDGKYGAALVFIKQNGEVETCRVEKVGWKRHTEQGTVAVVPGRE